MKRFLILFTLLFTLIIAKSQVVPKLITAVGPQDGLDPGTTFTIRHFPASADILSTIKVCVHRDHAPNLQLATPIRTNSFGTAQFFLSSGPVDGTMSKTCITSPHVLSQFSVMSPTVTAGCPPPGNDGVPQMITSETYAPSTTNKHGNVLTISESQAPRSPIPYYDIGQYGGYIGSDPGTTGSIKNGTKVLTLAAARDFANGHGILLLGAGPATALSTPTGVQAAPKGLTGSSTYYYCVVAEDYANGRTACSAAGKSTASAAILGINSFTLSSCNRSSGVVTCKTKTTHKIISGAQVNIVAGSTGDSSFEGAFTTVTASGTAFTFNQIGAPDASGTVTSGMAQIVAKTFVQWNIVPYSVLRSYIYRCTSTCALPTSAVNFALAGVVQGMDSAFTDLGFPITPSNIGNGDVPSTAPTHASNQWLSTTISSGGGTTSLTLANRASNTVSRATVLHDNTPNILSTCTIQGNGNGGIIGIPKSSAPSSFPIASTLNLGTCSARTKLQIGTSIVANGTIIVGAQSQLTSNSGGTNAQLPAFYSMSDLGLITGKAYPLVYLLPGTSTNVYFANLHVQCGGPYQSCVFHDEDSYGDNPTGARFDNVHLQATSGTTGPAYVLKGGFGYFWNFGGIATNATNFATPPGMLMTPDCGLGVRNQQLPGIVYFDKTYLFGGTVIDACGESSLAGSNHMEFRETLAESSYVPMVRVTGGTGANTYSLQFIRPTNADQLGGLATPMFDCTNGRCYDIHFYEADPNHGPIVETQTNDTGGYEFHGMAGGAPTFVSRSLQSGVSDTYSNANLALVAGTTSHIFYQMALPAAPQSAIVSSGGSVASGSYRIAATAMDADGNETLIGPIINSDLSTSSGRQTVTTTLPASFPAGATGLNLYRSTGGGGFALVNANACNKPQFTTPNETYVDTFAFTCGVSQPSINAAGTSLMSSSGLTSYRGKFGVLSTMKNCSSRVSPAVCGSAPSGSVIIPSATTTITVNTTAVTSSSQIVVTEDSSLGTRLNVTCNSTLGRAYAITARTAGTSFVVTASSAPAKDPACLSFIVVN